MIVRELTDGTALVISQEAHADLAAQFAAHWGNREFSRLAPYDSMLFATIYHDSGHREMEADLAIDATKGLPITFRGAPPEVRHREADPANVKWIANRDPYAALIVQMHHNGLRKNRYDTVRAQYLGQEPRGVSEHLPIGLDTALEDLEGWQQNVAVELGVGRGDAATGFWHNYRALQVFDLLSLHFCCDGFSGEVMRDVTIEAAPMGYGSTESPSLRVRYMGDDTLRMEPYPFDDGEFTVSVVSRRVTPRASETPARAEYHRARRQLQEWTITR
jgi:hypothetical protein